MNSYLEPLIKASASWKYNEDLTKDKDSFKLPKWTNINKNTYKNGNQFIIRTGKEFNLMVIDIDIKNGKNGASNLSDLGIDLDQIFNTLVFKTPSGGFHALYKYNQNFDGWTMNFVDSVDMIANQSGKGWFVFHDIEKMECINDIEIAEMSTELYNKLLAVKGKKIEQIEQVEVKVEKIVVKAKKVENSLKSTGNDNDSFSNNLDHLELLLNLLAKKRFDEYNYWSKIGMVIKYHFDSDEGFNLFDKFSKTSKKYTNRDDTKKIWDSFKNESDKQLKYGTLMMYAKEDNYKDFIKLLTNKDNKDVEVDINNNNIDIHYHDYYDLDDDKVWSFSDLLKYIKQRIHYLETSECFYIRKLIVEKNLDIKTNKYFETKFIDYIPVKNVYTDKKTILFIDGDNKVQLNKLVNNIFLQYISIRDVIFKPYSVKYPAEINKKELNLYFDINEHTYREDFKIDMNLVDIALNHLKIVICNNDQELYEYILNYICRKLQMPFKKTEACILLHSIEQGTGKTALYHLLQRLFGKRYVNDTSINDLQRTFNSSYSRCLFIILEETAKGLSKDVNDFLKKTITQKYITEEEKFMKAITLDDNREIMILTNNFDTVKLDNNDRRYCCINVSACKKNDTDYFNQYYEFIDNPDKMVHLYHYLINKDIKNYDPRKIIMTDIKKK